MTTRDQLEIINPTGEIVFYDLDPGKGITNIGRDPENDIVIESPGVASFHAVLDHRQKPFQIMVVSEEGDTTLGGQPLAPNVSTPLQAWDTVEIDGHAMMLLEGVGIAAPLGTAIPRPAPSEPVPKVTPALAPQITEPVPETPSPALPGPVGLAARPSDRYDEVILVELSEREWTIDVEQTATCDVTVTNGGNLVATFEVHVEGIDPSWVAISSPQINLFEGEQATLTVNITPPRLPSSRAGTHYLALVVTSPNHAGRRSQTGATLTLNPYYGFTVGELSPKNQSVSWRKNTGEVVIPIANQGNSIAPFRIEAEDNERACSFEFQVPGEEVSLVRQAEMSLTPEETFAIPIRVTPHARRLVGLRKRRYSFTVTTGLLDGTQTPRSVMGQLSSKPLIGPGLLALMALSLAILVVIIFRPRIYAFEGDRELIRAGEPVTLSWNTSSFVSLNLDPEIGPVGGSHGQKTVSPVDDIVFTLRAENLLSQLFSIFGKEAVFRVEVEPVQPKIALFAATEGDIVKGADSKLVWEVIDADELTISVEPPADFGDRLPVNSDDFRSEQIVSPEMLTRYTLTAINTKSNTQATQSVEVMVLEPTPTPVPTPHIEFFEVDPARITLGEEVLFRWFVNGNPEVEITSIGPVETGGSQPFEPEQDGTLNFWLRAFVEGAEARQLRTVVVDPAPTPTPEPIAPEIQDFRVRPEEVIQGDATPIQLYWLVSGDVTDIQISGPSLQPVPNLPKEGNLPVNAEETTFFILTVFGATEDQIASATVELTVLEPTPVPTEPPPPPTPFPLPNVAYFKAESGADPPELDAVTFRGGDPPTYAVVVRSLVELSWEVQNAVKVSLEGFGDQPAKSSQIVTALESKTYHLIAENVEGAVTDAFLKVELVQPEPPDAPFGLQGREDANGITLSWSYPSQNLSDILGFRIYRATVPPGDNFVAVDTLELADLDTFEWTDTSTPTCGKAYYLVARYYDAVYDMERETSASPTSWFSKTCPTPTP